MATRDLMKPISVPSFFEDFYRPWYDLFDNAGGKMWQRMSTIPPVNIMEFDNEFRLSLAAPGLKKDDFKVDLEGNVMTISCEKEEKTEEIKEQMTRREFSYTSFTRSFTLPENVMFESIEAKYEDGVLTLMIPKKEEARKGQNLKHIAVK
ncbi:MAG TPA: Hsp20/alpha crystallin family protein [Flavisolibacter sp.]